MGTQEGEPGTRRGSRNPRAGARREKAKPTWSMRMLESAERQIATIDVEGMLGRPLDRERWLRLLLAITYLEKRTGRGQA